MESNERKEARTDHSIPSSSVSGTSRFGLAIIRPLPLLGKTTYRTYTVEIDGEIAQTPVVFSTQVGSTLHLLLTI